MSHAPLLIDRRAPVRRIELDSTSWVDVVDGFVVDPAAALADVIEHAEWMQGEVLRYDRFIPERRLGAQLHPDASALVRQIGMHLDATYRVRFEGAVALQYRTGEDFQGLHSDREMRWLDDTLIAIVVLGVRRPFVFRRRGAWVQTPQPRAPSGADPDDIVLTPGDGEMLVMGGAAQRDWMHGVPAAPTDQVRVSLTWRWTSRRGRPDTNPGYTDGFQYGDRRPQSGYRVRTPGTGGA